MKLKEVLAQLKESPKMYTEIERFSDSPGIYAFFYEGNSSNSSFPAEPGQLIYIGKTESSQKKRDANTHFKSGKTGSSTFRKSIGSILMQELSLVPIPRNDSDLAKGRTSMFKFDGDSEERLTNWMKENISMTFFEFKASKDAIEQLETSIINELTPHLNISKNRGNPFKNDLQMLRKNAASIAHSIAEKKKNKEKTTSPNKTKTKRSKGNKKMGKYSSYWESQLPAIREKLRISQNPQEIRLSKSVFEQLGNRKRYSFNIEFTGVKVTNSIGGSAVARDLASVMKDDSETRKLLMGGNYKINMDKSFILHIQRV